jgi:hypothetical protein
MANPREPFKLSRIYLGYVWIRCLPLVEFVYNNSFQETIGMASFEALYGRKCRSPLYWDEIGERQLLGPEIVQDMKETIMLIRKQMLTAQSRQKSYADKYHHKLEFMAECLAFWQQGQA